MREMTMRLKSRVLFNELEGKFYILKLRRAVSLEDVSTAASFDGTLKVYMKNGMRYFIEMGSNMDARLASLKIQENVQDEHR